MLRVLIRPKPDVFTRIMHKGKGLPFFKAKATIQKCPEGFHGKGKKRH
jgi:hypothetical protein